MVMGRRRSGVEDDTEISRWPIEVLREVCDDLADHPLNTSAFNHIMPRSEMIERGLWHKETLMARAKHQTIVVNDAAGNVPVWSPSSPMRPPTHGLTVTHGFEKLAHQNFTHVFAAKKFFDLIVRDDKFKWINTKTIEVEGVTPKITIKSDELEEIVEYKYKGNEAAFVLPMPYPGYAALMRGEHSERPTAKVDPADLPQPHKKDKPAKTVEKKERVPRASPDGMITATQLAEQLGVKPTVLRSALRGLKLTKPAGGWLWTPADAKEVKAKVEKELKRK
jgi:hypothetical protein